MLTHQAASPRHTLPTPPPASPTFNEEGTKRMAATHRPCRPSLSYSLSKIRIPMPRLFADSPDSTPVGVRVEAEVRRKARLLRRLCLSVLRGGGTPPRFRKCVLYFLTHYGKALLLNSDTVGRLHLLRIRDEYASTYHICMNASERI